MSNVVLRPPLSSQRCFKGIRPDGTVVLLKMVPKSTVPTQSSSLNQPVSNGINQDFNLKFNQVRHFHPNRSATFTKVYPTLAPPVGQINNFNYPQPITEMDSSHRPTLAISDQSMTSELKNPSCPPGHAPREGGPRIRFPAPRQISSVPLGKSPKIYQTPYPSSPVGGHCSPTRSPIRPITSPGKFDPFAQHPGGLFSSTPKRPVPVTEVNSGATPGANVEDGFNPGSKETPTRASGPQDDQITGIKPLR